MIAAIALVQLPSGTWDAAVSGGHLAMDYTPATPMLLALGGDRRAEPDDVLPDGRTDDTGPIFNARRGWTADPLDTQGLRAGSRCWLIEREKCTEDVRLRAAGYASEAMDPLRQARGIEVDTSAAYIGRNAMRIVARSLGVTVARQVDMPG